MCVKTIFKVYFYELPWSEVFSVASKHPRRLQEENEMKTTGESCNTNEVAVSRAERAEMGCFVPFGLHFSRMSSLVWRPNSSVQEK